MVKPHGFHVGLKSKKCSMCICPAPRIDTNIFLRLAIRYQIRNHGPQITSDELQIIDNKRTRLQKLIDMFEHQADSYLLHHRDADSAPISPIGNYSNFDHVDSLDGSGAPHHSQPSPRVPQHLDGSGMNDTNPEDISILLPLSLGWQWCVKHHVQSLAEKEAKLR